MTNPPKISIVTPSFNQGRYLEETILSVLNQDYPNLEYFVIDGGSTDNSVDIIRKYADRITYWVSEKDSGQTHAINKGLERATGEIRGWLNSDDVYLPWTFRNAVDAFQKRPNLSLVWGSRMMIDSTSNVIGFAMASYFEPKAMEFCINSETAFWRKEVNESIGLLNQNYQFAMDLEFFLRVAQSFDIAPISAFQGALRCHSESKSSNLMHVCKAESERAWMDVFGISKPLTNVEPESFSQLRIASVPFSGAMPYIMNRIRRRLDDRRESKCL